MAEEENSSKKSFSIERILLICALGGNIGLGSILGLSPDTHKQKEDSHIELSETCEFKLLIEQMRVKELEKDIQKFKEEKQTRE